MLIKTMHTYKTTERERNLILESLGVVKMVYMQLHLYNKVDEVNLLIDKIQKVKSGKWSPFDRKDTVDRGSVHAPNMKCDDD